MDTMELEEMSDNSEMEEIGSELNFIAESLTEKSRMIEVLEAIAYDVRNGSISESQAKYVSFALESAFSDSPEELREVLATENIITRIFQGIIKIGSDIKEGIKKQIDYMQYSYTFFNLQKGRIKKIRDALHDRHGRDATVRIGINKYMLYGESKAEIHSMGDYLNHYLQFTKTMTPFMEAIAELTEEDLFSSLKFYKDYIFGEPEDYIRERFNSMERAISKASTGLFDKKTISKSAYVEYDSGTMLGLSRAVVRLPQKNTYTKQDLESMIIAHKYFYMYVDRRTKFNLGTLVSGNSSLDVSRQDIEKILDASEALLIKIDELFKFSTQLSHLGASLNVNYAQMLNKRDVDGYDPHAVVKGVQIFARICSMIFDSTSSGYNFSLGNIKQALKISEKAVKQF